MSSGDPVIIQAVLNEFVSRNDAPKVPLSPAEVGHDMAEVVRAGAGLIHFHPRDNSGKFGAWRAQDDVDFYREAVAVGRTELGSEADQLLWYPPQGEAPSAELRWRHVPELAADPGLEVITIDPGTMDLLDHDHVAHTVTAMATGMGMPTSSEAGQGAVMSPGEQWIWFCNTARKLEIRLIFGVFEPGFLRRTLALYDAGYVEGPLVLHFMVTDRFSFGLPAEPATMETYRRMVPSDIPVQWFCSFIDVRPDTHDEIVRYTLDNGGHVRAGLGSQSLDRISPEATNRDLVEAMVQLCQEYGRAPASPRVTRELLGIAVPASSA